MARYLAKDCRALMLVHEIPLTLSRYLSIWHFATKSGNRHEASLEVENSQRMQE
jgi:hypothetical protein